MNERTIKTRKQAAQAGENKYYTGKPCINGHDGPRYVSSGICCKCNSEGVKRYQKDVRLMRNNKAAGAFVYFLHPDDHAAALAYCQALDLQRGRQPAAPPPPPITPAPASELVLPEHIARHRRTLLEQYAPPSGPGYLPKP